MSIAQLFHIQKTKRQTSQAALSSVAQSVSRGHGRNLARGLVFLTAYFYVWLSLSSVAHS